LAPELKLLGLSRDPWQGSMDGSPSGCTIETTGDIVADIEGIFSYEDFC